jgi:pilus assembly protein CpaF
MRPNRIVVGEVRGEEVIDMLQAMNTGHDGSLTTVHANNPRDALGRLENLMSMSGVDMPARTQRQQICSAIQIIVQANRMSDGTRKITSIAELSGMEGEVITMQEIFKYDRETVNAEGKVIGLFSATGIRPKIADHLKTSGIELSDNIFVPANNKIDNR